jgi:hypothetical protein
MDWKSLVQNFLIYLFSAGTIIGCIGWIIKSLLTTWFSKSIEEYKNKLAFETALKMESFKSQLQLAAKEYEIRFTHIHQKRAEIIFELNKLLTEFVKALLTFERQTCDIDKTLSNVEFGQKVIELNSYWSKVMDYTFENSIYLGRTLSLMIMDITGRRPYWLEYISQAEIAPLATDGRKQLEEALELTRKEFQKILGIQ